MSRPGPMRTADRRRSKTGVLLGALLLSFGYQAGIVGALLVLVEPEPIPEPEKKPQLTMIELNPSKKEEEEPPPEPEKEEPPKDEPEKKPEKKKEPELEFEELEELEEEEKPEEEEEEKPEEKKEEKPPVDFVMQNLKMVEQPDELDEEEAPEDVNYLSNVNRDVQEETRAKVTNLEQDAVKPEAKQLEPSPEKEQGTANEDVIAQQQEQKSQLNQQAPKEKPSPEEQRPEQNDPKPKSLLAMRELEHRDHKLPQEAHEALAQESDSGILRPDQREESSIAPQDQQARVVKNDKVLKFKHSRSDLEALYGKDMNAPKSFESARQSKTKGVWEDAQAHWQSPLENMVPEVQVGNQTALRSRKHPFARYIAQIHRKIHEAWAWGYLDQLDGRARNHPLNDYQLWTRLEIVLNRDGTIDNIKTVRPSGKLAFDGAARETVYALGPFPNPPQEIVSGNGKIYIHWAFHRDERACGTFGAQPFILDNAGVGDRPDPNVPVVAGRGEQLSRRLQRKPTAPPVAEGPAPPPSGGHDHAGHEHEPPALAPPGAPDSEAAADDPGAARAAKLWLTAFAKGDTAKLAARSTLPFYTGDTIVARTRNELSEILGTMVREAKGAGRPKEPKIYTAAGLRKVFGSVPAGVQEGNGKIYALTKVGGDIMTLILEKKFGVWRVSGIAR